MFITFNTFLLIPALIYADCPPSMKTSLPFTVEYAIWRGWQQAIVYTPHLEQGCKWSTIRLVKCLNVNDVAVSKNSLANPRLFTKLGIIIISPDLRRNTSGELVKLINKLQDLQMSMASYDWLITARSDEDFKYVNSILNATSIRFDQNIAVAYPSHIVKTISLRRGLCDGNFVYKRNNISGDLFSTHNRRRYCNYCEDGAKTNYDKFYYRTSERFKNLSKNQKYNRSGNIVPLFQSGVSYNFSMNFQMTNISKFLPKHVQPLRSIVHENYGQQGRIYILQYFKVRTNSTLYASLLGIWSQDESMSKVKTPYPVEARSFLGEELIVGRCNSSFDGTPSLDDDGPSAPALLDDVLYFFTKRLNASSPSLRYYSKLGFRTYEGSWTGLLGALIGNSVDVALEPVTAHAPRHQDMDFIFPVAETMCNIYIRHQETSAVRDIFLAPFSTKLVVCVVAVALIASLAAVIINKVSSKVRKNVQPLGYTEALIWSTGILCQQGSIWSPLNPATSILLIVCLLFAVVTYNAYAAFITSVLSVRVASVDTVAAVLHSPNLKIGYIRNGADQMYLMSTKDILLNEFYIRGYSDAENLVSSAEEGLARAANQDYAFFAGQRAARSTLRSLSQARGRCAVRELPVHSTRAHLAFPLARRSPYAKPLLVRSCVSSVYSLLQLRSAGALARLEAALVPDMPFCATRAGFASARATDVRSAFILLGVGLVTALLLGLGEYCWKNRKQQKKIFINYYEHFLHMFK